MAVDKLVGGVRACVRACVCVYIYIYTVVMWLGVSGCICAVCYLFGLLFCQHSGVYWLEMFDSYSATLPLLFIGLFETIGVSYVYTMRR